MNATAWGNDRSTDAGTAADAFAASGGHMIRLVPSALNDGIAVGSPEQVGFAPSRLQALLDRLQRDLFPDLHSLIVWRRGYLVLEQYFNGAARDDLHDMRSAGKSV